MRTGGVVVLLVFGRDSAHVRLVEDHGPVQQFTAQGADEALADRVHPRRQHGGAHHGGAGGLEDGGEGCGEVRSAVTDQEPEAGEPLAEVQGEASGLLYRPVARWVGGDAANASGGCRAR
jgi:hypothetical protein